MRPILMSIVFLAASAWSSVKLIWTEFQFEKGYLEVDTAKICNVDTTYINCSQDRGLAYYSTMDTTFAVLFNPLITRVQLFKSLNVDEQRQAAAGYDFKMTAVLRYEFMKWQEWGIIKITKDSAQRLLDRILPESRDVQGRKIIHKKVCDEEMLSACQGEILWGGSGSPGFSEDDTDIKVFLKKTLRASLKRRFLWNHRNPLRQTRRLRWVILRGQPRILPRSLCGFLNRRNFLWNPLCRECGIAFLI